MGHRGRTSLLVVFCRATVSYRLGMPSPAGDSSRREMRRGGRQYSEDRYLCLVLYERKAKGGRNHREQPTFGKGSRGSRHARHDGLDEVEVLSDVVSIRRWWQRRSARHFNSVQPRCAVAPRRHLSGRPSSSSPGGQMRLTASPLPAGHDVDVEVRDRLCCCFAVGLDDVRSFRLIARRTAFCDQSVA